MKGQTSRCLSNGSQIIEWARVLEGVSPSLCCFIPPSLHQPPGEGGQGDRSPIKNKLQTPRFGGGGYLLRYKQQTPRGWAWVGKRTKGRGGEATKRGAFQPLLSF
jgi:hypothetical protein